MPSGLATRCTACGTVFRVVPDQLRVSDGWVRCGRCAEVFNAGEHLLDVDTGTPRRLGDEPAALLSRSHERMHDPRDDIAEVASSRPDGAPGAHGAPGMHGDARTDARLDARPWASAHAPPQVPQPDAAPRASFTEPAPHGAAAAARGSLGAPLADDAFPAWHDDAPVHHVPPQPEPGAAPDDMVARFDAQAVDSHVSISDAASAQAAWARLDRPSVPAEQADQAVQAAQADSAVQADPVATGDHAALRATPWDPARAPTAAERPPSFLRRAERAQRWRQPRVRALLWALTLLAGLGLAAQVAFTYRDLAAARFPLLRPALEQACSWLSCSVGEALAIDSLVVESSGLVRVERSSIYRLSVSLRNRAAIAVALPAVEIALTDAQGKLLARRVLRATELGAAQPALAAGRELALQATLRAATDPVAGYTIELFYP